MIQGKPAVIIACEFSGRVRDAFERNGCTAISIDLQPTESFASLSYHLTGDAKTIIEHYRTEYNNIDAVIAFPPCTYLCSAGAKHWEGKKQEQLDAIAFFSYFLTLPIPYAIENPVGIMSTVARKPNQLIQPYWFGEPVQKKTHLWLNGLPKLHPTNNLGSGSRKIHWEPESKSRSKNRSRTFPGVAEAMGKQWGDFLKKKLLAPPGGEHCEKKPS